MTTTNSVPGNKLTISEKEKAKVREMIVTIAENLDLIVAYGQSYGKKNLDDIFKLINNGPEKIRKAIRMEFGIDYELIRDLILDGYINKDLLELRLT
jgi:hypothetical protein